MNIHRHIGTQPRRSLDAAFSNFLTNLSIDGTYTVNTDVLERAYNAIPYEAADADIIMVAGAYKSGSIACYDNVGNIVDLGFSRSTSGYRLFNDLVDTPINTPRLDNMCYSFVSGYTIENQNTFIGWTIPTGINLTRTLGTSLFTNPHLYRETAVNQARYIEIGGSAAALASVDTSVTINLLIRGVNQTGRHFKIDDTIDVNERAIFDLVEGKTISKGTRVQSANIRILPNGFYLLNMTVIPAILPITTAKIYRPQPVLTNNNTIFLGDISKGFDLVSISLSNRPIEAFTVNPTPNTVVTKGADTIAPITLTNNAVIHIKTAKGLQVLNLPAGVFNVNNYVVNDKLILFTIKYL